AFRRPPRRAEDPALEFVLARLSRWKEPGGMAHIRILHGLHGMRSRGCALSALGHRRRTDGRGVGKDGQDHAHGRAHALLAEELHGTAVPGDD
ncbi:hypothetical protein KCW65_25030, partial [Mycobacterium tuberculosis]|nr:hypothetical protein [Mycobacterium tuberculosis]